MWTMASIMHAKNLVGSNEPMEKQLGIENWKLMDYAYCPQIVQELIEQGIQIQDTHNALMIQLQPLFEWKQVLKIMDIIDDHKEEIKAVHGIDGNSVYLLLNYGLSRTIIRDYIFGKVNLEDLLFMNREQIMKTLDLSVYTASKIMEACRFAMHMLVEDSDYRKQEILRKDVCDFFRGTNTIYTIEEIMETMLWRSSEDLLIHILDTLEEEDLIIHDARGYKNKKIFPHKSLSEVLDSIHDMTARTIVVEHLYGKTMESIGLRLSPPISRSRVSQIFHQEIDHFPIVKEDVYRDLLMHYDMDKDTFYALTDALEPTYGYIQERYHEDLDGTKIQLNGDVLSRDVAKELIINTKKLKQYLAKHYLHVYDQWVSKDDRNGFLQAICHSFDGYFQKKDVEKRYNKILHAVYPEKQEEWALHDFRLNSILKQGYLVHSAKKGSRYRIVSRKLVQAIIRDTQLAQYKDTIVSTKKVFEDHRDVMEMYDIRDQYELHSLLRTGKERYQIDVNEMEFSRMPMLVFGHGNENEIVKQEIKACAPIDVEVFARHMANKYGYDIRSFYSYLRRNFNVYIEENRIDIVDEAILHSQDFQTMKNSLTEDFYFVEDYQNAIEEQHLNSQLMDAYVIRRLGYKLYAGYLLKEPHTPGRYFEQWIQEHASEIQPRHMDILTFQYALERLEKRLDVFEWTPGHYVTLKQLDISKKDLKQYIEQIKDAVVDGQYFTQQSLKQLRIVSQQVANSFYKSLLKSETSIQMMTVGDSWVFVKNTPPNMRDFFLQLMHEQPGLTVNSCITYLYQWYGIRVDRRYMLEHIIDAGLFYSLDTDRMYESRPQAIFTQERLFE